MRSADSISVSTDAGCERARTTNATVEREGRWRWKAELADARNPQRNPLSGCCLRTRSERAEFGGGHGGELGNAGNNDQFLSACAPPPRSSPSSSYTMHYALVRRELSAAQLPSESQNVASSYSHSHSFLKRVLSLSLCLSSLRRIHGQG